MKRRNIIKEERGSYYPTIIIDNIQKSSSKLKGKMFQDFQVLLNTYNYPQRTQDL